MKIHQALLPVDEEIIIVVRLEYSWISNDMASSFARGARIADDVA